LTLDWNTCSNQQHGGIDVVGNNNIVCNDDGEFGNNNNGANNESDKD
jgi:hypothetical protein